MILTPNQIERLYLFTRQHYVEFYDLQTELVDHLANAIEQQWQENPKLPFEDALQIEFKKFGVFGFMNVVEQRQAALNKKYNNIVWHHFKTFFQIPQILGTFSAIGILFFGLKMLSNAAVIISVFALIIMISFWISVSYMARKRKKRAQKNGKKWLLNEIIYGFSSFVSLSYLPFQFLVHFEKIYSDTMLFVFSIVLVFMLLIEYIILIVIPSKAEDYLKETYPEYEILK